VRIPVPPLLLVTDRSQARRPLEEIVARACAAGGRWVSLREKHLPAAEQIALARTLLAIVRGHDVRLTLHGEADVAFAAGADGVHLSAQGNAGAARALLGPGALIGKSIHSAVEAAAIDPRVVDYAVAGPAYQTASKPGYGPALGPNGLAAISRSARVPVIAIGGIEPDNAASVLAAGAAGIAVMGSVMRTDDPGQVIEDLLAAIATTVTA
jgi:thiamine-phosphate pyrophosphorylase